jgi:hypothetical protein
MNKTAEFGPQDRHFQHFDARGGVCRDHDHFRTDHISDTTFILLSSAFYHLRMDHANPHLHPQ